MTHHLRLEPNGKVIVELVEMSHLCIEVKKVMFVLHLVQWWRRLLRKAQLGSLLPHEVYVDMSCISMMSHNKS